MDPPRIEKNACYDKIRSLYEAPGILTGIKVARLRWLGQIKKNE